MNWEDTYDDIRAAGFMAGLVVKDGDILGIEVESPAIQLDARVNILKELLGNQFAYTPHFNEEIISITKQNHHLKT